MNKDINKNANKYHLTFTMRVKIENLLNLNLAKSAIKLAKVINVSRNTIYYELKNNMTIKKSIAEANHLYSQNKKPSDFCETLTKFPFVCNGCANVRCSHRSRFYSAYDAQEKANKKLHDSRYDTERRRKTVKILNNSVCQLIKNGQSINVAISNVNNCDLSSSTVRRYIEKGLVNAKRIDLPRATRFRVKKEYNYKPTPLDVNIIDGRTYEDYKKYIEAYPDSRVIELDSVIGKINDSKAILTVYFKGSKLQLGFIYHKKRNNIVEILRRLLKLGLDNGYKLFDVILTDNGTEFKKLHELEFDEDNNRVCRVFYCDPYRSCQKAECEKNHSFFRRIIAKGKSFNLLSQEAVDEIFSHINSYPRASLKNQTPIDIFNLEYNPIILLSLNILKVERKDVMLKDYKSWGHHAK